MNYEAVGKRNLNLTITRNSSILVGRKWKAHWWGSRTSNPVNRLNGRLVGSIPMHFRQ
jgi:hypothetical protein